MLNRITLLTHNIDEAIKFYTKSFGFKVRNDEQVSTTKRFVVLSSGHSAFNLVTPKPGDEDLVGHQSGQRVFGFINSVDLNRDLERFQVNQVQIIDGPRIESFGRCLLVKDLSGNIWEFVERP